MISQYVYYFAPLLLLLLILFYPMSALAIGVAKACRKTSKLGTKTLIKSWVPIFNMAFIRNELYGSNGVISVICWIIFVGLLCRPLGLVLYYVDPVLSTIGTLIFWCALVAWYLLMVYTCIDTCTLLHRKGVNIILSIIAAPVMAYILSSAVPIYFKENREVVDGTFDSIES